MIPVQNFAFDDSLVRVVMRGDDPWFAGKDVCQALGIAKHHQALERLDPDERGTCTVGTPSGEQSMIVVCEAGVYRLAFTSRKEEAKKFTRWVAHDVLPTLRKTGRYELSQPEAPALPGPAGDRAMAPDSFLAKLTCIREARMVFGRAQAQIMWRQLGLPAVPPPPLTDVDEARMLLRHILDAPVSSGSARSIRDCLDAALADFDEAARLELLPSGIRPLPETGAFVIANQSPWLWDILDGTEWRGRHGRILRRLPGVTASGTTRFGARQHRGTLIPEDLLDPAG